jgi:radical SAM-linked protein
MEVKKYPLKITLSKSGDMVYFSQLDIMHLLERALRRTDLPLYYTQGFNPHVKISFHSALKLGQEGQIEITLYFSQEICPEHLKDVLGQQLPEGLSV